MRSGAASEWSDGEVGSWRVLVWVVGGHRLQVESAVARLRRRSNLLLSGRRWQTFGLQRIPRGAGGGTGSRPISKRTGGSFGYDDFPPRSSLIIPPRVRFQILPVGVAVWKQLDRPQRRSSRDHPFQTDPIPPRPIGSHAFATRPNNRPTNRTAPRPTPPRVNANPTLANSALLPPAGGRFLWRGAEVCLRSHKRGSCFGVFGRQGCMFSWGRAHPHEI